MNVFVNRYYDRSGAHVGTSFHMFRNHDTTRWGLPVGKSQQDAGREAAVKGWTTVVSRLNIRIESGAILKALNDLAGHPNPALLLDNEQPQ